MSKKDENKLTQKITVKFNENYVASRGAGISGGKGQERTFPWSPDLERLIEEEVVSVVKVTEAAKREKATSGAKETAAAK